MLKTRVMPCLLLRNRGLVKTIKFKDPAYIGDPVNTVRIYNEKEVDELIVLDITATPENRKPPFRIIDEIAGECFMPFTYGGGIRDIDEAREIFSLGVEKIAVNTHAIESPAFITQLAERFGSQSIMVSVDARKKVFGGYEVYSHGGRRATGRSPVEWATMAEKMGAGEILLTSINRDGTMEGYDLELIKQITRMVNIPVIACGGAGEITDFEKAVKEGGASAVAAGSMVVYQGRNRAVLINFPYRRELSKVLD